MTKALTMNDMLPLKGLKVLDFSQFLAGPYCALKLADLGADVVKVERSGLGDLSRYLYLTDTRIAGESTIFHAINRNKRSVAVDLKSDDDKARLTQLVRDADVILQNFRPGVMERLGFGYDAVKKINPTVVYGTVTGYGSDGPWVDLPGRDLLAQARSGSCGCRAVVTMARLPWAFRLPMFWPDRPWRTGFWPFVSQGDAKYRRLCRDIFDRSSGRSAI